MKLAEIRELMETFDGMNICRLELEDGAFSLVLSKEHTPAQPPHREEPSRRREPELRPMPPAEAEAAAELTPAVPETPAPVSYTHLFDKKRISLSIKALLNDEAEEAADAE